jgi:ubiquinone/menaquinone biosynthesis C-methylase UbiE
LPVSAESESRVGRTFGRVAETYERLRPEFAPEGVERAVAELGLGPDSVVLDLAAGTGKLTRPLARHVGRVIAVEPDADMRQLIPGDARAGAAEQIPLEDDEVDAVFVGDAFTWFDAGRALAEIVRVLRPGGGLALLWRDWYRREQPPMPAQAVELLTEVYMRFRGDALPVGTWREDIARSPFGPLEHASFSQVRELTGRELADLELTRSSPAALEDRDRAALGERLYSLMAARYTLTVVTEVEWARLA